MNKDWLGILLLAGIAIVINTIFYAAVANSSIPFWMKMWFFTR